MLGHPPIPQKKDSEMTPSMSSQYQAALDAGRFQIQRCKSCSKAIFYPRELCPHCGSDQLAWEEPSGNGTVYSTTVIRRKAEAGGDYNLALIDLAEGARMMGRVEGTAPADVKIGLAVKAQVIQQGGKGLVVFKAALGA